MGRVSIAGQGSWNIWNGFGWLWSTGSWLELNESTIVSENHPNWKNGSSSGSDDGGPFTLWKKDVTVKPYDISALNNPQSNWRYEGTVDATNLYNPPALPTASMLTPGQLDALGATAISRCEPTKSVFQGATAIGESLQELPRIPLNGALRAKSKEALSVSGDEYLNVQFGWLPMVSDLKKFCYAVKHHNKIIQNFEKHANKKNRVRYAFPNVFEQVSETRDNMIISAALNSFYRGNVSATLAERTWFAGAFRYYVPVGSSARDSFIRAEEEADKLLGLRLTPEVVWNLAPWSWAVDWFSNAGDVFHNISALGHDGLAMQYGYIMHESKSTVAVNNLALGCSKVTNVKYCQRQNATPFGFGLNLSTDLSVKQKAIIAALGLSRGGSPWLR